MMRVLIVEEIGIVSQCLQRVLESESDIRVIATATDVEEAASYLSAVDIALVNRNLPNNGATALLRLAQEDGLPVKVVITAVPDSDEEVLRHIEQGASGYVGQTGTLEEIMTTLRSVHADEAILPPRIAASLMARLATLTRTRGTIETGPEALDSLTGREMEVLELIRRGLSNSEIANELIIEVGTVKNHVHSILKKLEVPSRRAAAALLPDEVEIPMIPHTPAPPPRRPVVLNPTYALLESQGLATSAR